MPTITSSDGVPLSYLETGDPAARPVVLIAGFKASATSWHYQLKPLARAGHRVIAFDRRGHGRSGIGAGDHTMDRHGADIHDLLTALELDDVTLVGQSMGGNAIWALVQQFGSTGIRDSFSFSSSRANRPRSASVTMRSDSSLFLSVMGFFAVALSAVLIATISLRRSI